MNPSTPQHLSDRKNASPYAPSPRTQFESEPFKKYQLMMEYSALKSPKHCPRGMYIMPSPETINIWYGVMFITSGLYKNAVFKFRMSIPFDYPNRCPSIAFLTDSFHPLIDINGNFSITPYITWVPGEHFTFHVLHLVKRAFSTKFLDEIDLAHSYNKDAWKMYNEQPAMFAKLAAQASQLSLTDSVLYDNYPESNPIRFSPLSDTRFEQLKQQMLNSPTVEDSGHFERQLRDGLNSLKLGFTKFINGDDFTQ